MKVKVKDSFFSPESDFFEVEGVFYDACRGHPHSQNVLLRGKVVW